LGASRLSKNRARHLDAIGFSIVVLLAGVVNALLVHAAGQQFGGEEVSVSALNPVLMEHRLQCNAFTSNNVANITFGILRPVMYNIAQLDWIRVTKAIICALTPGLIFLIGRRRLRLSWPASLFAGAIAGLTPGLFAFNWLAHESGFDAVPGLAAFYIATGPMVGLEVLRKGAALRRSVAIGIVGGIAVGVYAASLSLFGGALVAMVLWRGSRGWRPMALRVVDAALAFGVTAAVVFGAARLYSNSHVALIGGGAQGGLNPGASLRELVGDLLVPSATHSYYFFSTNAGVSWIVVALAVAGVCFAFRQRLVQLVVFVAVSSLVLEIVTSPPSGIRRANAALLMVGLLAGVGIDRLSRLRFRFAQWLAAAIALAALVDGGAAGVRDYHALRVGTLTTPVDFRFARPQNVTIPEMVARLDSTFPASADTRLYEPDRLAALLIVRREAMGENAGEVWNWWLAHAEKCNIGHHVHKK
jgi:hypothetical protein